MEITMSVIIFSMKIYIVFTYVIHVMCVHNTFYDRKLSTSMSETSQVLLAGVPVGFSRGSLVSSHIKYRLVIDLWYTLKQPNIRKNRYKVQDVTAVL